MNIPTNSDEKKDPPAQPTMTPDEWLAKWGKKNATAEVSRKPEPLPPGTPNLTVERLLADPNAPKSAKDDLKMAIKAREAAKKIPPAHTSNIAPRDPVQSSWAEATSTPDTPETLALKEKALLALIKADMGVPGWLTPKGERLSDGFTVNDIPPETAKEILTKTLIGHEILPNPKKQSEEGVTEQPPYVTVDPATKGLKLQIPDLKIIDLEALYRRMSKMAVSTSDTTDEAKAYMRARLGDAKGGEFNAVVEEMREKLLSKKAPSLG